MNKIYKLPNCEELDKYDIKDVEKLGAEWFVYFYLSGFYDGNGFVIWKEEDRYGYHDLSHCSCYGPTQGIGREAVYYPCLSDIEKFANNYNGGKKVIEFIKRNNLE